VFVWDEDKRLINIEKHGLDFCFAELALTGETITFEDTRHDYGEKRLNTYGLLHGRLVIITHMARDNTIRIISMRKGNKREQDFFKRATEKN